MVWLNQLVGPASWASWVDGIQVPMWVLSWVQLSCLKIGFWAGNSNVGDIMGLIVGDIVVQRMDVQCYYAVLVGAANIALAALLILTIQV
jgi:hypothetical protein